MNRHTTYLLLAVALGLFLFILLVERHTQPTSRAPLRPPTLLSLQASAVTSLQVRVTNQLVARVERTNGGWQLTLPRSYPARSERIEQILEQLEHLHSQKLISVAELSADQRTLADFGLDVPQVALAIQHGGQRSELLFGAKTALGDQVYVQQLASPDVYLINAELLDRLPRRADGWRDRALLSLNGVVFDRLEVRAPGRGFALELDPTNKTFFLTQPTPARADGPKVDALLRDVALARVVQFVADPPIADLEQYGLEPPVAEFAVGKGTNDLVAVQFGASPTNNPALVYARHLGYGNVVLVAKALLDTLLTSYSTLRNRHLLTFAPDQVDAIEVTGPGGFAVQRDPAATNTVWNSSESPAVPVDPGLVRDWLDRLSRLQGVVEKDVVTDYAPYGLDQPVRQLLLRHRVRISDTAWTNQVLARLDFGTRQDAKVFVRRPDENSAYSIALKDLEGLPSAAWQLRDRQVFRFQTNAVASVTIRQNGYERKFLRSPTGSWSLAPGSLGMINTFAVEEMMYRLGQLRANLWVDRGEASRVKHGFTETNYRIEIELRTNEQPKTLILEFGKRAPSLAPLAATIIDGQPWVFEFPVALYYDVIRYLSNPPKPTATNG